jgi:hypothetical protein
LAWFLVARARCLGHNPLQPQEAHHGREDRQDQRPREAGRRAVTGDEETKREGERQEDKGAKGKLDSAVDRAQDALEDLKDKADRR